jgi:hypothetical protein
MRHRGFVSLAGGVLGVALQLQQAALWGAGAYLACLALGALGTVGLA